MKEWGLLAKGWELALSHLPPDKLRTTEKGDNVLKVFLKKLLMKKCQKLGDG